MCGRMIRSSAPIPYGIVEDGMNVRDRRVHNYPPRRNGAPIRKKLHRAIEWVLSNRL
jgi:hypothetical protein